MVVWHAFVNFFHCLPLWIVGSKILSYAVTLEESGFHQTKSEEESLGDIKALMIVSPIIVALVVPLIQFGTLYLYYNYGHPWCRLFVKFKKPGTKKSKSDTVQKLEIPA